jgi:hypothetical protein
MKGITALMMRSEITICQPQYKTVAKKTPNLPEAVVRGLRAGAEGRTLG